MYLKRTVSFLVSAVLTVSGLMQGIQIPASAETAGNTAQTEPQVQASATSQVGGILANAINEDTIRMQSPEDYFIDSITMSGNTATVRYSALIDCKLIVSVYDKCNSENYEKMIAIGTADVLKDEKTAVVVIPDIVMPQYYLLKAYLIREDGALLSEEYVETGYTEEIQHLMDPETTIDTYEDDYEVLNLDGNDSTNFAVFKKDVIVLDQTSDDNIIQTEDTVNGKYEIQNLSQSLKKNDIVAIRREAQNNKPGQDAVFFKVIKTSKSGNTTTVTAYKDFDAADAFEFMKVEFDQKNYKPTFDENLDVELYKSSPPANPAPGQNSPPSAQSAPDRTRELYSSSFDFANYSHSDSEETSVSPHLFQLSGHIDYTIGFSYYSSGLFSHKVISFEISGNISLGCELEYEHKWENKSEKLEQLLKILGIRYHFFGVDLTLGIFIKIELSVAMEINLSFTVSNVENNVVHVDSPQIKGEAFIGIIGKGTATIFGRGLDAEAGAGIQATVHNTEPHSGCSICLAGDIALVAYYEKSFNIFNNKFTDMGGKFGRTKAIKLFDFYISYPNGFGIGICPNRLDSGTESEETDPSGGESSDSPQAGKVVDESHWLWFIDNDNNGEYAVRLDYEYLVSGRAESQNDHPPLTFSFPRNYIDNLNRDHPVTTIIGGNLGENTESPSTFFIPNSITRIGRGAFAYPTNSSLKNISIPSSVTSIGDAAFSQCSSLSSIMIPSSVTSIGNMAFRGCSSLTNLVIPESVKTIGLGNRAFEGCTNLKSITLPDTIIPKCQHFAGEDEGMYADYAYRKDCTDTDYKDTEYWIGNFAFKDCKALTEFRFPTGIKTIGSEAFSGCSSLSSITIPDTVETISSAAFKQCTRLSSITIPGFLSRIQYEVFSGCSGLKTIKIPSSVTHIHTTAFSGCSQLSQIYYAGNSDQWKNMVWDNGGQVAFDPDFVNNADIICEGDNTLIHCKNGVMSDPISRDGVDYIIYKNGQPTVVKYDNDKPLNNETQPLQAPLNNLVPDTLYNFYYYTGSTFDVNNLQYISQGMSDANGNLTVSFYPIHKVENPVTKAKCFPPVIDKASISQNVFQYTGKEVKVGIYLTVKSGNTRLKYEKDFTMTYADNIQPGYKTASVTINGNGAYLGSATLFYSIAPVKQDAPKLSSTKSGGVRVEWEDDPNAHGYQVQYCQDSSFKGDTLHTASYSAGKTFATLVTYPKPGETWYVRVRAYVSSDGSSTGKKAGIYSEAECITLPASISSVELSQTVFPYTGKEVKVGKYLTVKSGDTRLKYETDFIMTYSNNINAGYQTASVTVTGVGKYTGTITKNYTIGDFPIITKQPADVEKTLDEQVEFTVEATGKDLTYQWQYDSGKGWTDSKSSGANTPTVRFKATEARDGIKFHCIITSSNGTSVTSEAASLTVRFPLGDVDLNGVVNADDADLLFRYIGEDPTAVITIKGLINADVNQDGIVNVMDVSMIMEMSTSA